MSDGALRIIQWAALCGILVSLYALHVEHQVAVAEQTGAQYEALCDINDAASCSKVLTSEYGKILSHWGIVPKDSFLDVPNALTGLFFYGIALVHNSTPLPRAVFLAFSVVSVAFSLFLAYVLKFVLHDFCAVCVTSYVLNIIIFAAAARRALRPAPAKPKAA